MKNAKKKKLLVWRKIYSALSFSVILNKKADKVLGA